MGKFRVVSDFQLTGDQPRAVEKLAEGLAKGYAKQTLLGVTGSGKTFAMAKVVEIIQRPTLVICHNKTLAAQLYSEFKEFFPDNAVEYFVSYYDYYQPEAYLPRTDTYIEKETDINEEIDKLRLAATRALFEREDSLIVASVSCIYGLGSPEEYLKFVLGVKKGEKYNRDSLVRRLVEMQYERNDLDFRRGKFRIRGDTLEILPAYEEAGVRLEMWGDEVERIVETDPLTGEVINELEKIDIYPAKHFVTSHEKLVAAIEDIQAEVELRIKEFTDMGKPLEAARIEARTKYDIEMLRETGYCNGIENYSRHLTRRPPGSPPATLIEYFPSDYMLFIDESHMTLPQIRGMYNGDTSRKQTLVDFGFRLPSAMDNRPLNFEEFEKRAPRVIYVSATPGPYEYKHSQQVAEQIIRPTGLLEPTIEVKPSSGQVDDLIHEIKIRVERKERCLVTTLTKRLAEELADYLKEMGVRTHYLHSEIDTLERVEILRDLRMGVYDVVVGINLLREGLDLPEVSLVAILDADKEGFLRSKDALIQTMGRASRHVEGHVIMYADEVTKSMRAAIQETYRRRSIQVAHNKEHGITPQGIKKAIKDITERLKAVAETRTQYQAEGSRNGAEDKKLSETDIFHLVKDLEVQMKTASRNLEFEKAAIIRDRIIDLKRD
ncbi:MAG: excinuclease ABC subunit UvrB, partial [Dehalococcoidia bacterium]|nr:excinuclease ABC subunit UvrB [Dehalococcoidia bacterium]